MSKIWLNFCLFWAVSTFAWGVRENHETNLCPTFCHCDLFGELNRADCSYQKLITADIEVPKSVEVLYLDDNDINVLEDKCFEGFVYLVSLTLSHNAIHTIYLNAFVDLKSVEFIDLSHNRLEVFDERIFESNQKLRKLDLSGNKFMLLDDKPMIISASLQNLVLHDSQIPQLTERMFSKMPALTNLDLSGNLMIDIPKATLTQISRLKFLDLRNNKWRVCHDGLKLIVQQLRSKDVQVQIDICNENDKPKMFERMMALPEPELTTKRTPDNITNIWRNLKPSNTSTEVICTIENLPQICELHQLCTASYKRLLDEVITPSPEILKAQSDAIYVALYAGLFLGVFITLSLVYIIYSVCVVRRRSQKKARIIPPAPQQLIRNIQRNDSTTPNPVSCAPINRHEPNIRRPVRRTFVRVNRSDFFLSSIFERPAARRNLRSNPFRSEQSNQAARDLDRLISGSSSVDSVQESPISQAVQNHETTNVEPLEALEEVVPSRAETPPPAYNDIVSH